MKSRAVILTAVVSLLVLSACKKPPEPTDTPSAPDPQTSAGDASAPGTTTNFETPAPAEPARQ